RGHGIPAFSRGGFGGAVGGLPQIPQLHGRDMPVTLGRASPERTAVLRMQPSRRGLRAVGCYAIRLHKQERGNAMLGLMQDWPLLCHRIIDHAAINHAERPIVTRSIEGPLHATTYAEVRARALRLAQRLHKDGLRLGDRVATLAWNTRPHLQPWDGSMGVGATDPTSNPR